MFLCDFHREQAWVRWFKKSSNRCSDIRDEALSYLRSIAYALSEEEMKARIDKMKNTTWWNEPHRKNLRKYITKTWLRVKKVSGLFYSTTEKIQIL